MSERPCIVLGVESQIGLAIIRELGLHGIRVVAVSHTPHAIGLFSRHVWRRLVVPGQRSAALLAALRATGDELGACSLITISEANLMWLQTVRHELSPLRPALPDAKALRAVLDKQVTLALATEVGILVPRTEDPRSLDDIDRIAADFPFPAVLKWKDPNAVAASLATAGIPLHKAEFVYDAVELRTVGHRYSGIGRWPLIQQYCPGRGLGQFIFMHQGRAVRRFQHLRIAEWPPEGGFSSVCEGVPLARHLVLQERSTALLQRIGWSGVAMVEYRLDEGSDQAWLMEINGRFWGSLPLASHAGAGFALLAHYAALGEALPELPPARDGLRCRMVATELKRLWRLLIRPELVTDRQFRIRRVAEVARFIADFFRPRVSYYVWNWRDPQPFLKDLANLLLRRG